MSLPCEVEDGSIEYYCENCPEPCPDERALRNIDNCYKAIHNGNCPSNCEVCKYGFREREP